MEYKRQKLLDRQTRKPLLRAPSVPFSYDRLYIQKWHPHFVSVNRCVWQYNSNNMCFFIPLLTLNSSYNYFKWSRKLPTQNRNTEYIFMYLSNDTKYKRDAWRNYRFRSAVSWAQEKRKTSISGRKGRPTNHSACCSKSGSEWLVYQRETCTMKALCIRISDYKENFLPQI